MPAQCDIDITVKITGLGVSIEVPIGFTTATIPAESAGPIYSVIGTSVQDLDLADIAADKLLGVLIIARVDSVGILITADGTGTPSTTANNILLDGDNNEATYLNFASGLNASGSIRIIGDAATAAIEYYIFGKA